MTDTLQKINNMVTSINQFKGGSLLISLFMFCLVYISYAFIKLILFMVYCYFKYFVAETSNKDGL
jgi:hypothetical protein